MQVIKDRLLNAMLDLAPMSATDDMPTASAGKTQVALMAYVEEFEIHRRLRDIILAFVLTPLPDEPVSLLVDWVQGLQDMEQAKLKHASRLDPPSVPVVSAPGITA